MSIAGHKQAKIAIFQTKRGELKLNIDNKNETIWATQRQIAELFEVDVNTVIDHTQNIYKDNGLIEKSTTRKIRVIQIEGSRSVNRELNHYNLDMIVSIGYRINSKTATQFRK